MQYQREKFLNAVAFFAKNTDSKVFGVTKLMKLLFFSDFLHYEKYGRPIVGDLYFHLPEGPVPTESYDLWTKTFKENQKTGLEDYIKVVKEKSGNGHDIHRIESLRDYDENVFSESDIEVMKEIAEKFHNTTGTSLANQTHSIPFVKETPRVFPIDYINAIKDEEDKRLLIELQNEDEEVESVLLEK